MAPPDLGFLRLSPDRWAEAEDISIDYALIEKAHILSLVPFDAVWRESGPDENGVVAGEGATAIDCRDTLLRLDSDRLKVVGIGLENIMAVAMNDPVLVADKPRAPGHPVPQEPPPWGWFESLMVATGSRLSGSWCIPPPPCPCRAMCIGLNDWIVVEGTAKITVDDTVKLVTERESVYIPLGAVHQMENPGKVPMVLIEVQTGAYVGEDDIIRYEDAYRRGSET